MASLNIQKQPSDIKEAKEQKRLISAEYAKLNEERQKQMAEMLKLFEEGQKHQGVIQDNINKSNKIRDEFREKEKAYNAYIEAKAQLQKMKGTLGFTSEAEIDKRVADIKYSKFVGKRGGGLEISRTGWVDRPPD